MVCFMPVKQDMPTIITPELIPHEDFHTGRWLLPVKRPGWYYFMKSNGHHEVQNRNFLPSVDKPLRELVTWLHKRGIKTTPSCAGHVFSKEELDAVYDDLEKDAVDIVNSGLELKDIESGEVYLLCDPAYRLPWTRREFLHKISSYQQKGVRGLRLGRGSSDILLRLKNFLAGKNETGIAFHAKNSILFIHTRGKTYRKIRHAWKQVTRALQQALS